MLTITETEPTPILKDFAAFIYYLKTHQINLTKVKEFIPGKNLFELNQQMTHPQRNTVERTTQNFYPLFHLFYHLVLGGKLFQKVSETNKMVLKPTERLQLYEDLKPAEKYFFLLETFWTDTDWEKLQEGYFRIPPFRKINIILESLGKMTPGKKILLHDKKQDKMPEFLYDLEYFFHYFSYFGFWEITPIKELTTPDYPERAFMAESITPAVFGVSIAPILNETRDLFEWNLPHRRKLGEFRPVPGSPVPGEEIYGLLSGKNKRKKSKSTVKVKKGKPGDPFFLPFVPLFASGELQKTLPREEPKFMDGTYVFKVSLKKSVWWRIELSSDHMLLDLHNSIQNAYHFDDDHLYSFFMDGKLWSYEKFTSPYDDEGPHVDEVRIGELGLSVGQNILYLFDYGDMWRFRVELEEIRTEGSKPGEPKIIESKGKSPEQYEFYED